MLKINTERKNYIDVMRGLGMILVIWAHIFQNSAIPINKYIYAFHMPLFFLLLASVHALRIHGKIMSIRE